MSGFYIDKDCCRIITKDGAHFIETPKGEILNGVIFTRVHDEVDCVPTVLVKMYCSLKPSPTGPK